MRVEERGEDARFTEERREVLRCVDRLDHGLPGPPAEDETGSRNPPEDGDDRPTLSRSVSLGSETLGLTLTKREVLKETRWPLLKNATKLDEIARLREALELNAALAAAYYPRRGSAPLCLSDKQRAARFLEGWMERGRATDIRQLG